MCWQDPVWRRLARWASPISWSTSHSRARLPIRRRARSPRRSKGSADRSTRRPTVSRRSTGSAFRTARPRGRWTCSASSSSGPSSKTTRSTASGRSSSRRSVPTSTIRPSTARSSSSRQSSATARSAGRSVETRPGSGRCPSRRSAISGPARIARPTWWSRSPVISSTSGPSNWPIERSGEETASFRRSRT